MGESISRWDSFYSNHFQWIYNSALELTGEEQQAIVLTHKIFLNVLLSNPELVLLDNEEAFRKKVSERYPDLKRAFQKSQILGAHQLMRKYYTPN